MTYTHVRKEKGLNIQFSKAGEMRLGVCGSGKTKEVRKAEDRRRDSHGARGEKQKLGSENKIGHWFPLFSDTE